MSRQQLQEVLARLDPAKLHCEVLEGCGVEVGNVGRHRIRHERGLEVVMEGLAGRLLDADLRHRSSDQERLDTPLPQPIGERGAVEGAVPELLDDDVVGLGVDLLDDICAVELLPDVRVESRVTFPAASGWRAALRRPLPEEGIAGPGDELRVDHREAAAAERVEERPVGRDRGPRVGNLDRDSKSRRLNYSHGYITYLLFCFRKTTIC